VDGLGSAYVTGFTTSTNFPISSPIEGTNAGGIDVFVTKLNPSGSALVYSTYLGGSSDDFGQSIAVDSSGTAYITGQTDSANFPTVSPIQGSLAGGSDAFISKLNSSGSALLYSTYLGGNADDKGNAIAVDISGSAYIAGSTTSANFPTMNPIQGSNAGGTDVFVAKLSPSGSALVYATYLGGIGGIGAIDDGGHGITVDKLGCAYVIGKRAYSSTLMSSFSVSVRKLNSSGSAVLDSIFLSGGGTVRTASIESGGIALDSSGNVYITGSTDGSAFPTVNPIQGANAGRFDVFITKLDFIETISIPTKPTGPTSGIITISYSYSTGGSTTTFGHPVEYQFDWKRDGSDLSPWGSATQSKT
jgi:hypothetical protein